MIVVRIVVVDLVLTLLCSLNRPTYLAFAHFQLCVIVTIDYQLTGQQKRTQPR